MKRVDCLRSLLGLLVLSLMNAASLATELPQDDLTADDLEVPAPVDVEAEPHTSLEDIDRDTEETEPFVLLEQAVEPGGFRSLHLQIGVSGRTLKIPVFVSHGSRTGPTVCLIAAVHGDELNGIEIARQVVFSVDPAKLAGTVVAVPIVNMEGFVKQSRYIADRRDLNRYFPGDPKGVTPARYAYQLFENIIRYCDALIDLHTGSYFRTNLPQLRADMTNELVENMVGNFGAMTVLHSKGAPGMLRNAAVAAGIPSVTMEVGGPLALQLEEVEFGIKAINTFLNKLGMIEGKFQWRRPQPVFFESEWLVADHHGILITRVELGQQVKKGDTLATITDPFTNIENQVIAPFDGTVLGKGVNQFISEGFLVFRLGRQITAKKLVEEASKATAGSETAPESEADTQAEPDG